MKKKTESVKLIKMNLKSSVFFFLFVSRVLKVMILVLQDYVDVFLMEIFLGVFYEETCFGSFADGEVSAGGLC